MNCEWWVIAIIVYVVLFIFSLAFNIFYGISNCPDYTEKTRKRTRESIDILMCIAIFWCSAVILYFIGWIWYYFCGGFLLFEELSLGEKVAWSFMTMALLSFVLGFIATLLGWKPFK